MTFLFGSTAQDRAFAIDLIGMWIALIFGICVFTMVLGYIKRKIRLRKQRRVWR